MRFVTVTASSAAFVVAVGAAGAHWQPFVEEINSKQILRIGAIPSILSHLGEVQFFFAFICKCAPAKNIEVNLTVPIRFDGITHGKVC